MSITKIKLLAIGEGLQQGEVALIQVGSGTIEVVSMFKSTLEQWWLTMEIC